ncbi:redoxin domain-containing protein [Bradyrhizobium liaoningense]|uniref:redoxin domain-containing protein n=1 Tax=Bradyrhizobium liaoningense TaxID=43992 RepID=UPI0020116502|nr:redoxin domain-containing protein [Bradyrhizobium liaoningense]
MRKSENAAAATSRPAAKPSKRDAAVAMRSATEYLIATRQADRALKAGNCAPSFRLRDQHGPEVASETLLRHSPLFFTFYTDSWCPACDRDSQAFESLPPSVEARGASLVSASQQTVAENAKARAHLKLASTVIWDRGGRIAQLLVCAGAFLSHEVWGLSLTTARQRAICKVRR